HGRHGNPDRLCPACHGRFGARRAGTGMGGRTMTGRERVWAALVSTVMLAAVAWPAVRGSDGFPLSNYPMFSRPKDSIVQVYHVVAHSREGRHRPLPPAVLGTDEIMQAYQTVKFA